MRLNVIYFIYWIFGCMKGASLRNKCMILHGTLYWPSQNNYRTDPNSRRVYYFRFSLFWCGYYSNFVIFYLVNYKKYCVHYSTASSIQLRLLIGSVRYIFTFSGKLRVSWSFSITIIVMSCLKSVGFERSWSRSSPDINFFSSPHAPGNQGFKTIFKTIRSILTCDWPSNPWPLNI